jgi:O-antigen/teichoic acid export membrane protein
MLFKKISHNLKSILVKSKEQKKYLLKVINVFSFKIFGALITLILYVLLSRYLGASEVGKYYLSLSIITMAATIGMVGLNNAVIKYSAQIHVKNNILKMSGLQRKAIMISVLCSIILTLALYIFSSNISNSIFNNPELTIIIQWMSLAIVPMNMAAIFVALLKGVQKSAEATIAESVIFPLVFIIFLLFVRNEVDVHITALFHVAAAFVGLSVSYILWRRVIPGLSKLKGRYCSKSLLKTSLPLLGVSVTTLIMSFSDIVMLGIWHETDVVGVYGAVVRVASVSTMFLVVANTLVSPKVSILYKEGRYSDLSALVKHSTYIMIFIATQFLLLFIFFPDLILSFFGSEFSQGGSILMVYAIGQFFVLATGPVAVVLMMTGHERFHRNTTILSAVVNIVLNFILIPKYGAIGAAFATSVSLILKNMIAAIYVKHHLDRRLI